MAGDAAAVIETDTTLTDDEPVDQGVQHVNGKDKTTDKRPSAEDAIAEAMRAADARVNRAERERDEAVRTAGQATAAVVTEREAAITAEITAAESRKTSAKARLRAAKEAGNVDDETDATEEIAAASGELVQLNKEKALVEAEKTKVATTRKDAATGDGQPVHRPTTEAQAWIAAHPMFNADREYTAVAIGFHQAALAKGFREGSPEYVRHIDQSLERVYGPGHGNPATHGRAVSTDGGERRADNSSSSGLRPNSGGGSAGGEVVKTLMGDVRVIRGQNGQIARIEMSAAVRAKMEEGARITGMSAPEYAAEHVEIARLSAAGEPTGMVISGQQQVFK